MTKKSADAPGFKKHAESRRRYLRSRVVWEGGKITCECCNLPNDIILEGSVVRTLPSVSTVRLSREEIANILYPVVEATRGQSRVTCPKCARPPGAGESRLYMIELDAESTAGPMCIECVGALMRETNVERQTTAPVVWVVKCHATARAQMKFIDFTKRASLGREAADFASAELLY